MNLKMMEFSFLCFFFNILGFFIFEASGMVFWYFGRQSVKNERNRIIFFLAWRLGPNAIQKKDYQDLKHDPQKPYLTPTPTKLHHKPTHPKPKGTDTSVQIQHTTQPKITPVLTGLL